MRAERELATHGSSDGLARDGLIDTDRPTIRLWARIVTALFALGLVSAGAVEVFAPVEPATLLGIEAEIDRRLREDSRLGDGTAARLFERERKRTSRLRRSWGASYGRLHYRLFHEVGERLLVGEGGRLYLPNRIRPVDMPTEQLVGGRAAEFQTIARRLASRGVALIVGVVPRKSAVDAAYLPSAVEPRAELYPALIAALADRGVHAADLWTAMLHRDEIGIEVDSPYYRLDSHWNQEGARRAAEALCAASGLGVPREERRRSELRPTAEPVQRADLPAFAGFSFEGDDLPHSRSPGWELVDPEGAVVGPGDGRYVRRRVGGRGAPIVLVGTSFSASTPLPFYLSHCLDRPLWNAGLGGELSTFALNRYLESEPSVPPRLIVFEIPAHESFTLPATWVGKVLDTLDRVPPFEGQGQPSPVVALLPDFVFGDPLGARGAARETGTPFTVRGGAQVLVDLAPGIASHTGGGTFGLRLRGHVEGPDGGRAVVRLHVVTESFRYVIPWRSERDEILVPLLGAGPVRRASIEVDSLPATRALLRLDSVEGVIEAAPSPTTLRIDRLPPETGARGGDADAEGSWTLAVEVPSEPLPARSAVLLRAQRATAGNLRVEVGTAGGASRVWTLGSVREGGVVVVELDGFAGQRLARFLVEGRDAPGSPEASGEPFLARMLTGPRDPSLDSLRRRPVEALPARP